MYRTRRSTRRLLATTCVAVVAWAGVTACGEAGDTGNLPEPGATGSAHDEEIDVVATGLDAPWSIAFHGVTALVGERDSGRILELGVAGDSWEVGVVDAVQPGGEGGLLGIAVHEGDLYSYVTAADGNRIERRELTGGPGELGLGEVETILDGIPAARVHNGGRIAFGPDGKLYATTGDAGDTSTAQDRDSLAGKILRLEPDGSVPADNPFPDSPIYSYGHRNPQGIAWDADGTLYASEFGQNTWDELNIIEPGANYGWPEVEGVAGDGRFVDPVQQFRPADASPSGMAVAGGAVYIAGLRGERLIEVPLSDAGESDTATDGYGRLRDVIVAPDGALWVLTNNTDGRGRPGSEDDRILRFDPRKRDPAPASPPAGQMVIPLI